MSRGTHPAPAAPSPAPAAPVAPAASPAPRAAPPRPQAQGGQPSRPGPTAPPALPRPRGAGYLHQALSLAGLVLSGSARARRLDAELDSALRLPLPRTCRVAVVPTAAGCGATTTALHLAALVSRARGLPALVLSASPGPASAADRLGFSRPWPPEPAWPASPAWPAAPQAPARPSAPGLGPGTAWPPPPQPPAPPWAPGPDPAPAVATGAQARELTGTGPDGLLACLRLPPAASAVPQAWDSARLRVMRFFDLALTETGCLPAPAVEVLGRHHHAVVLVSPAEHASVERTRALASSLEAAASRAAGTAARAPRILHAVVATAPGRPRVPALRPDELLVGYDPVLAVPPGASVGQAGRRPPGFLRPATARSLARLAGRVLRAAAAQASRGGREAHEIPDAAGSLGGADGWPPSTAAATAGSTRPGHSGPARARSAFPTSSPL